MKRFVSLLVAIAAVFAVSAQQSNVQNDKLERAVVCAQKSIDSLNMLIAEARSRYLEEVNSREKISTQLLAMEEQALVLKRRYDSALAALVSAQQRAYVSSGDGRTESGALVLQQNVVNDTASVAVAPTYHYSANLVYNGIFESMLGGTDLRMVRDAQQQEGRLVGKIKEYLRSYDRMVSLQLEYERVDTEVAADSVLSMIDSVRKVAFAGQNVISDSWHAICDNKIYAYNFIAEKQGYMDLLSSAEGELAKAQRLSDQNEGAYESDVLCDYFFRKQAMLNYERKVAEAFELSSAVDSLEKVQRSLQKDSYCLPKINIIRRSFIEHEPLKVIKPIIYTSANPIPRTKIYEYGTVYRIRIGIFTNRPNLTALKGITPLSYTDKYHGGKYAYFVGGFRSEEEALEGVEYLKKLGFKAPQPVMWVDGEYISNIQEWKSKNLGFNIEITGVAALSDAVKSHIMMRNDKCRFSRVGTSFIIGTFASKADAEIVVSEIIAMDGGIKAEIKSVK